MREYGNRRNPLEQFEIVGRVFGRSNTMRMIRATGRRRIGRNQVVRSNGNGSLVPNRWQTRTEGRQRRVSSMIQQTMGIAGQSMYPFVYTRFTSVLRRNLLGLIPYSFTVTSHLVVTRTRARGVWVGKRRRGIRRHGRKLFGRFLPGGTPFLMIPLRVPLERLGFVMTFVSLSVRLFANMMAGHILLKVIAGFAWTMMGAGGRMYLGHRRPRAVLFRLLVLETGVAVVQAYVFALLTCIYTADMLLGGH
jgi:ATP synthase subunit 6